jgi:hypothetical protein
MSLLVGRDSAAGKGARGIRGGAEFRDRGCLSWRGSVSMRLRETNSTWQTAGVDQLPGYSTGNEWRLVTCAEDSGLSFASASS